MQPFGQPSQDLASLVSALLATGVRGAVLVSTIVALSAVLSALWLGARPHVEAFGDDAAFHMFAALRRRLGLPDEHRSPPDDHDR